MWIDLKNLLQMLISVISEKRIENQLHDYDGGWLVCPTILKFELLPSNVTFIESRVIIIIVVVGPFHKNLFLSLSPKEKL